MTTTETTRDWSDLRDDAEQSWEMAVETCHDCEGTIDEARQAECQSAMDAALDAWDRAIAATDAAERVAALEEARALADEWGDDATEREALRLVAPVTVEVAAVHTSDVREVILRVAVGDETGEASAMFERDQINGGWRHVGDSIDCWLRSDDIHDERLTRLVCDYIGGGARVGDRYVRTLDEVGVPVVDVQEEARG